MINEDEYKKVVARNLRNIMWQRQKTQAEVARDLRINKATLSAWMNGTRTPKMSKIDMLCRYFGVQRSDIMEPHEDGHHYVFDETQQIAQTIYDNPDLHALFDAARGNNPDNLKLAAEMLKRMKETNNDG